MNRETKRMLQRQGQLGPDGAPLAAGREQRASAATTRAAAAQQAERPSFLQRVSEYLREVRNELVKVAWPGRAEVIKYTIVVFSTIVLLTSTVFGLDFVFAKFVIFLFPAK
ncbi:MAG: preprotein translocase subunit SecE [Acidimicrobiales bacterium]|jgi:preprotein translocase subunit SecE